MKSLKTLLKKNREWAASMRKSDPKFFDKLSNLQEPEYLWIGCSDSRVPANQITGLLPGEVFVHRNVANIVYHSDLNCLSAIQYAVDVLKVKHIIVCGHYGCGGVGAALEDRKVGLVDNWLRPIQDIKSRYGKMFTDTPKKEQWDRLCELNVVEQVINVSQTTIIRDAWKRKQELTIHGWVYSVKTGLINDLEISVSSEAEANRTFNKIPN